MRHEQAMDFRRNHSHLTSFRLSFVNLFSRNEANITDIFSFSFLYCIFYSLQSLAYFRSQWQTHFHSLFERKLNRLLYYYFFSIRHHNGHDNKAELCGNSMMILTESFSVIFKWNKNGEIPTPYYAIDGFEVRLAHKIHIRSVISIFPSVCASFFSKWFLLFKCLIFRKCK